VENKTMVRLTGEWWTLRNRNGRCLTAPTALFTGASATNLPPVLPMFCKTKALAEELKQAFGDEGGTVEQVDLYPTAERIRFLEYCGMSGETLQLALRWAERDKDGLWRWKKTIGGVVEDTESA
jgi:hypothetical protein